MHSAAVDPGVTGRWSGPPPPAATQPVRRRAWSNPQRLLAAQQVVDPCPWPSPASKCRATLSRAQESLSKQLVFSISRGNATTTEVLQSAMTLPGPVLLDAVSRLLSESPPSARPGASSTSAGEESCRLTARQLLMVLESRQDAVAQLQQTSGQVKRLCHLISQLSDGDCLSSASLQQAESVASARLRWPNLLSWVSQTVLALENSQLDADASCAVLQALSSAAHLTPASVQLPLLHALLSSPNQPSQQQPLHAADGMLASMTDRSVVQAIQAGSQHAQDVAFGLCALSHLHLVQPAGSEQDTTELKAAVEHLMVVISTFCPPSDCCPAVLAQLTQLAVLHGCIPPAEFTEVVAKAAWTAVQQEQQLPAAESAAVHLCAAVGLLLPYTELSQDPGHDTRQLLLQAVLQRPCSLHDPAANSTHSLLAAASHTQLSSGPIGSVLAAAALASGSPDNVALTLRVLSHSASHTSAQQSLLDWLSRHLQDVTTEGLCAACIAVSQLQPAPAVQQLQAACTQRLQSEGSADPSPGKAWLLAEMAHAYSSQRESNASGTAGHHPLYSAALAALNSTVSSELASQTAHLTPSCLHVMQRRDDQLVTDQLLSQLASQPQLQQPHQSATVWLLQRAVTHVAWTQPDAVVQLVALFPNLAQAQHLHQQRLNSALLPLLQVTSLTAWGVLDWLSQAQMCRLLTTFAHLRWRPGLLVAAITKSLASSLKAERRSHQPPLMSASQLSELTRCCWALGRLEMQNPSCRQFLQLVTGAALQVHESASQSDIETSSFLSSMDEPVQAPVRNPPAASTSEQQQPVGLDVLSVLLWCHAKLGASGRRPLLLVRSLVLSILSHPSPCALPQLGRVWWSVAKLGMTGARLTAWLAASAGRQLQQLLASSPPAAICNAAEQQAASKAGLALSQICWGMQQMDMQPDSPLLTMFIDTVARYLPHMRPTDITQTVFAILQWAQPVKHQLQPQLQQLSQAAARQLHQRLGEFHTPGALHLVWALAKAGQRVDSATLSSLETRLMHTSLCSGVSINQSSTGALADDRQALGHLDDTLLSQFLWACSVSHHQPTALLTAYAEQLPRRLKALSATAAATVVAAAAYGLGSCGFRHDAALQAASESLGRCHQAFSSEQLSLTLFGMALVRYCPIEVWKSGVLLSVLKDRAPGMKLQELTHTLWALSQWPLEQMLGEQRVAILREAVRPVLLVHVLGAQVSASAAYDAAGERTLPPQPAPTSPTTAPPTQQLPMADPPAPAGPPGYPFGQVPVPGTAPLDPTRILMNQRPPISSDAIVDLAVGAASLGVCTPDVAEAITGWAMSLPMGGLSRFSSRQLCNLLWAFAQSKHDRLSLFEGAADLLVARTTAAAATTTTNTPSSPVHHRLTIKDLQKLLWAWAKFNRHPGEDLLEAVRVCWLAATQPAPPAAGNGHRSQPQTSSRAAGQASVDQLCSAIHSLAILREHRHPLMEVLVGQLVRLDVVAVPAAGNQQPQLSGVLVQHAPQLAATLLAAQAERQESPLETALPAATKALVLNVWRKRVARPLSKQWAGYVGYVRRTVSRMGLPNRVVLAQDGLVCPDITLVAPSAPHVRFALELVGPHNTAANSGRLLGDSALKYRLLQARGYLVVPISCKDWDSLATQVDKAAYIEAKLEKRLAALAGASSVDTPASSFASLSSTDGGQLPAQQQPVPVRAAPSRIEVTRPRSAGDMLNPAEIGQAQ